MLPFVTTYARDIELILAFIAAFGALLIWHLPRYRSLAVFFLFQSVLMLLNMTEQAHQAFTGIFLITPVFTLAKGPLLYLFIRAMVNETPLSGWKLYRHFLAMLLVFPLTVDPQFVVTLGTVSQIIYMVACFRLLRRYHSMARIFRSDADELELTWVVNVFRLFIAQIISGLLRLNLQPALEPPVAALWFSFDVTFLTALCCYMLYRVLRQPLLYDSMLSYEREKSSPVTGDPARDNAEALALFKCLETLIADKYLYRKPRLAVDDIARETGLQIKDISWAINLGSGQNFNEYINRLRLSEVKQQLLSPQSAGSLLDLAFAAGFNSKSTFNAVFKRETGTTPSQFIKHNAVLDAKTEILPVS